MLPQQHALKVGGLTPFTTIDYPGKLAAVVFVQGCPWRCRYCHNPHLQSREQVHLAVQEWPTVREWLHGRRGLLDAVVFSGGEPTIDSGLAQAMDDVRRLGFAVGLHTAGMYPRRLRQILPLADWVGLDVKAPPTNFALQDSIVGVRGSAGAVSESLALVLAAGVDFECRTTAHPALLSDSDLLLLARELSAHGVQKYAVQMMREVSPREAMTLGPVPTGYPRAETVEVLNAMFRSFVLRRD